MRLNLIKKATICALSISCLAALASCSGGSTTKVFANKDIQAYAKKYDITYDVNDVRLYEYKDSEETLVRTNFRYALLKNNTSGKYRLFMRYADKFFDIPTDEGEEVTNISEPNDLENSYGYFIIIFDSGKKMAIDYKGQTIVEKQNAYSVQINSNGRLIDYERYYTGNKTFYDFVTIETADEDINEIYEVKAVFEKGLITDFVRTKVTNINTIDYAPVEDSQTYTSRLKKYDFYLQNESAYVKDINGKLVSSFAINKPTTYYVLDDTLFYQTTKTVTINDSYTFKSGNSFYDLKTYTVDLLTGKTKELKDYKYYLTSTTNVYGYNEKDDRTYTAAIYANLTKIENKKLDLEKTTAMVDKNGKILSSKLGEKGNTLRYFDDKTYILYDGSYVSFISNNGSVKATYDADVIDINLYNKQIFITDRNDFGYFVDNNLKIAGEPTAIPYELEYTFKNGNVLLRHYNELFLASINKGEITIIEKYERMMDTIGLYPDLIEDNVKTIFVNDSLRFNNIYLVEYESNNKYTIEIHSVDGSLLKKISDVTSITYNSDSPYIISIETADETYNYAVNYINAKTYSNGYV